MWRASRSLLNSHINNTLPCSGKEQKCEQAKMFSSFFFHPSRGKIVQHFPREIDFFFLPRSRFVYINTRAVVACCHVCAAEKQTRAPRHMLAVCLLYDRLKIISSCLRKIFQHFSCHFCSFFSHYEISSLSFAMFATFRSTSKTFDGKMCTVASL